METSTSINFFDDAVLTMTYNIYKSRIGIDISYDNRIFPYTMLWLTETQLISLKNHLCSICDGVRKSHENI